MFSKIQFHFSIERWKFNEEYQLWVSTDGRVRYKDKTFARIMTSRDGYLSVRGEGIKRFVSIHRLVMQTWKPIKDYQNLTVDHLNHNKRDNSLKNLEWCSEEENSRRAQEDFLGSSPKPVKAKKKKLAKTEREELFKNFPWLTESIYCKTIHQMGDIINYKITATDSHNRMINYTSIWSAIDKSAKEKGMPPKAIISSLVGAVIQKGKFAKKTWSYAE